MVKETKLYNEQNQTAKCQGLIHQAVQNMKKSGGRPIRKETVRIEQLTDHFRKLQTNPDEVTSFCTPGSPFEPITTQEVKKAIGKLKGRKALGPDGVRASDVKNQNHVENAHELNGMIADRDPRLTEGYIVPVLKPARKQSEPTSYRPITILKVLRKLFSTILLNRIRPILDETTSHLQHAYTNGKSITDVVLAHKLIKAAGETYETELNIAGVDMSKAFDMVDRIKLLAILREIGTPESEINIIAVFLSNATFHIKMGKKFGGKFVVKIGVPQGDSLSPKLFTSYLNHALETLEHRRAIVTEEHDYTSGAKSEHDYAILDQIPWPAYLGYADDLDFIGRTGKASQATVLLAEEKFETYNLKIKPGKTEFITIGSENTHPGCLLKIKKLGTLLDDEEEWNSRKVLSWQALKKLERIWRKNNIKVEVKRLVYKTYIESILLYNSPTWATNKAFEYKIVAFHRRQLRWILNMRYPKRIRNEELYFMIGERELSIMIAERRKKHLGHALRLKNAASDIHQCMVALDKVCKRKRGKRNLKTIEAEMGPLRQLLRRALAREFRRERILFIRIRISV